MDPRRNPYAPGAGTPPPELAGRDRLIEDASIALDRIRNGLAAKSLLLVGLRGVGKTVLLNRICRDAEARGFVTVILEAPEDRSLPTACSPAEDKPTRGGGRRREACAEGTGRVRGRDEAQFR